MAKQKSGLHKQVSSIFGDYSGTKTDDASVHEPRKQTSFPGNLDIATDDEQTFEKDSPKTELDLPLERPIEKKPLPASFPKENKLPEPKKVMLPASLATPGKMKMTDRVKMKMQVYKEENGTRQLYSVVAIPVLSIILAFFLWNNLFASKLVTKKDVEIQPAKSGMKASIGGISWQKPSSFPSDLRDPMREVSTFQKNTAKSQQHFEVKGIVYIEQSPQESTVLIGKMTVKVGDQINGAVVKDIQRDHVVFESNGQLIKQGVGTN